MNIAELKESKFLKKEDAGRGILVTIEKVTQENVAKEGAPQEMKWCVWFSECEKPMVLNSTNGQIIASITGSDDTDNWAGHKVVLYHDPNITFGGKLVGGIRVRAPRPQPAQAPAPPAPRPAPQPSPLPPPVASAVVAPAQNRQYEQLNPSEDDVPF